MTDGPWTDDENDLIVADYFAMLRKELAGSPYSKTEHRRALCAILGRSETAIEYKHRNISAVLHGAAESAIRGYKAAFNIQASLEDAVARWFVRNPEWTLRPPAWAEPNSGRQNGAISGFAEAPTLRVVTAPTVSNRPPPEETSQMERVARRFDVAERDARNRALGRAGEELALEHERATLRTVGRDDLARQVEWVSDSQGDGAGYDIASFEPDGRARLIEVKTTRGRIRSPFYISSNEVEVSVRKRDAWVLMRLYDFDRAPVAFELRPPLERHVELIAANYRADFL